MKILVCDPILDEGIEELKRAGFEVDVSPTISNEQLRGVVSNYDALIVLRIVDQAFVDAVGA